MPVNIYFQVPGEYLKEDKIVKAIKDALTQKTRPHLVKDFRQTVYGWKAENKPYFAHRLTANSHELSMFVYAREDDQGQVYRWVSNGTKPHRIPKRGSTYMRFKSKYTPATKPGILKSRRSYKSGKIVEAWVIVEHPGIAEPREFDKTVAEEYNPYFAGDIQPAIDGVSRKMAVDVKAGWQDLASTNKK